MRPLGERLKRFSEQGLRFVTDTGEVLQAELRLGAGLIRGGYKDVIGELYELDAPTLARCDVKREHPVLYRRDEVELSDGSTALAYFLSQDQTRGLRRLRGGDWLRRFG